jgi:hypothetical protein
MTKYIGPFQSENTSTGREMQTELQVEPSEAYPGLLDVGVFNYNTGSGVRTLYLDKAKAEGLRDALDAYLNDTLKED